MEESVQLLGFDIGGTKTAWGLCDSEGTILKQGVFPTPQEREPLLKNILEIIATHKPAAVGVGIAGTVSTDHHDIVVCPNVPDLSHFELVQTIREQYLVPVALDNDARCALIGEVWKGAAQDLSSALLITIGTGIGGAVMQKEVVLPHPHDITQEIKYLVAEPQDLFPAPTGRGSIEGLIGGKNLEERFGISMGDLVARARKGDAEAIETFKIIAHYFIQCVRTLYDTYHNKLLLVGGKGCKDLDLYLQESAPCEIRPTQLGEAAGIIGAARLALDLYEQEQKDIAEWGDEDAEEETSTTPEA